jgi:hypothetical protein
MNSDLAALKSLCTAIKADDRYRLSSLVDEKEKLVGAGTDTIEEPASFARTQSDSVIKFALVPAATCWN